VRTGQKVRHVDHFESNGHEKEVTDDQKVTTNHKKENYDESESQISPRMSADGLCDQRRAPRVAQQGDILTLE